MRYGSQAWAVWFGGPGLLRHTDPTWSADDYLDLTPTFPDLRSPETIRASVFEYIHWKTGHTEYLIVGEMDLDTLDFHITRLSRQKPSAWRETWLTAFSQELRYRADRHDFETQTRCHALGG